MALYNLNDEQVEILDGLIKAYVDQAAPAGSYKRLEFNMKRRIKLLEMVLDELYNGGYGD
jgi:uncharacterized circularly permuted ATP-grasp superfamily protein